MDLINRQDVLDKAILIPIAKIVTEDKIIYRKVVFVDDIEKLPSAELWVPCSERLPEVGEDVFISVGERVCEAHLRESKDYFLTHKIKELVRVRSVDAWIPLPKAYEGGTE